MLVVAALGGNALLERGETPSAEIQERHVAVAVEGLAPVARQHDLVVTHGNGPQVGLLASESANDPGLSQPYPFDVLGAETQGMIGYFLLQAFENALPDREVVSLLCQTLVDEADPAFEHPTKFVGPVYSEGQARALAERLGWHIADDGPSWRRVMASPEPLGLVEMPTIRDLLADGALVICAGGGGIPVRRDADGALHGVEAVVDKDLTASLLARQLGADVLLLLTDVAHVQLGFGTDDARPISRSSPEFLREQHFPTGSMGPKVDAACRFVETTGRRAVIGRLEDAPDLLAGDRGTVIEHRPARSTYA